MANILVKLQKVYFYNERNKQRLLLVVSQITKCWIQILTESSYQPVKIHSHKKKLLCFYKVK